MCILNGVNLSLPSLDVRVGSLASSGFVSNKSFFFLIQSINSNFLLSIKIHMKSKALSKVKAFAWLVANKQVNTNDLLKVRRSFKTLSPDCCTSCMCSGDSIDHLLLHCLTTLEIRDKLFKLARLDYVPPRCISDRLNISFRALKSTIEGTILWQIACLTLT